LYNWSNHKVVQCDGWLWDPCYRTRYQNLTDMRKFPIVGHTRRPPKGKGGSLPVSAGEPDVKYEVADDNGTLLYFRCLSMDEITLSKNEHQYAGPTAKPPGERIGNSTHP